MVKSAEDASYLVEVREGVLRLSFNRPEFGNAVPQAAVPALTGLFREAQAHPAIRCILIRGEGRIFSAGGDVAGFKRSLEQDAPSRRTDFTRRLPLARALVEAVFDFDRPIVASVRGAAAGAGLFYPLVADYAIGDETATFVFAHQKVGLTPDAGLTTVLPQVVGLRMARMLILTAAKLGAAEALRIGILHRIVPADTLEEESMRIALQLSRAPQTAIKLAKRMVNATPALSLGEQLDAETAGIVECVGDDDFVEGVAAFMEKRPASFPSSR